MALDIQWFLDQRKVINNQFIDIISQQDSVLDQDEELMEFCSTITDYLAASLLKLGIRTNYCYASEFSDKYSNGAKSWVELRSDLSKLILFLSEHWNKEDAIIKKLLEKTTSLNT